jgi:DNA alkylation damage repair protein AlkB
LHLYPRTFHIVMNAYKTVEKQVKSCKSISEAVASGIVMDPIKSTLKSKISLWGQEKEMVTIGGYDGIYIILGALNLRQQLNIAKACLEEWIEPPNTSNIPERPVNLWQSYLEQQTRHEENQSKKARPTSSINGLRWVTLGYHYDWLKRKYDCYYNQFPTDLATLCSNIVVACDPEMSLSPEAAIINLYPKGSFMGGHQDDAELSRDHPVVSLSLGCACTFLIGGHTKDEVPIALMLRSGDALIFGGPSRLRFHGVPKVWQFDPDAGMKSNRVCILRARIYCDCCNEYV